MVSTSDRQFGQKLVNVRINYMKKLSNRNASLKKQNKKFKSDVIKILT